MSNNLSGASSLAYQGTNAAMPPNMFIRSRAPTPNDYQNVSVGDFWIYRVNKTTNNNLLYVLMGVAGNVADWALITGSSGNVISLTADTGGPVFPVAGNINVFGGTVGRDINTSGSGNTIHVDLNNAITLGDLATIAPTSFALNAVTGSIALSASTATAATNPKIIFGSSDNHISFRANNVFIGEQTGNDTATGIFDIAIGPFAMNSLTSGNFNTAIGNAALQKCTTGIHNNAYGYVSMALLTTGQFNNAYGYQTLSGLLTGTYNTAIGDSAGGAYTGAESNNICINSNGTVSESNTLHIGSSTGTGTQQLNASYIHGIYGITVGSTRAQVYVDSTGKLGTGAVSATPAFSANLATPVTNVTGDGTTYGVIFDVATGGSNINQTGSYDVTTGIFTAPISGVYQFSASVVLSSIGAGHTLGYIGWLLNSSGGGFGMVGNLANFADSNAQAGLVASITLFLNASDTMQVAVNATNSTKTVGVGAGHFGGSLIA